MGVGDDVKSFIAITFLLLGALFGMMIMSFIFGNLGPGNSGLDVGTIAFNISQAVQNNSLGAIETYSEQADTQFNTAAIAIVLLILISLFAIFWKFFIGGGKKSGAGGMGNFS